MSRFYFLGCAALLGLLPVAAVAQNTSSPALLEVKTADTTPLTRLRLQTGGGLYLGGTFDGDANGTSVPAEGSGTRLIWYPEKAAFRSGYVENTQWDAANIGWFSTAAGYNVRASGDYGTAFGYKTTAAQQGSTAIGQYCTASGAASVALGYYAHTNTRQGSFVFADRSVVDDGNDLDTDESFRADVSHSANWRVSNGFRIYTSSNRSTGVIIQSGGALSANAYYNPSWYNPSAVISTYTGAYLSTGGAWTNSSDRRKKHLLETVAGEDVLTKLRQVPITRWSYKADPATVRHLGPMAQDFRRAFGLGQDSTSIATIDADGVALAAAQALDARTQQHDSRLAQLEAENLALRTRLDALERQADSSRAASLPWLGGLLLLGLGGTLALRRQPARG